MALRLNVQVVRDYMEDHNISEPALAKLIGVNYSHFYRALRKDRGVGPKLISGLVKETGLQFNQLFSQVNEMSVDNKEAEL